MAINLSNVNISLRQFQEISSGDYNAGEVKLPWGLTPWKTHLLFSMLKIQLRFLGQKIAFKCNLLPPGV